MKKYSILITLLGLQALACAQTTTDLSFEFQAYPTGLIPGIRLEWGFQERHALHLRVGYNWIRHRDLGVHADERGDGFGGTLGYRYFLSQDFRAWFLGLRADIWRNKVAWEDPNASGVSNIWVLQPTLEGGYLFLLGENQWIFAPSLAFGAEINVVTEGAEVGQGLILLLGFSVGKRF